jgi:hypothetical protein
MRREENPPAHHQYLALPPHNLRLDTHHKDWSYSHGGAVNQAEDYEEDSVSASAASVVPFLCG